MNNQNLLYDVQEIKFKPGRMILKIDGKEFVFNLSDISERLANASKIETGTYRVSPSGYGIHWPLIDEDLSVPGLLKTAAMFPGRVGETAAAAV